MNETRREQLETTIEGLEQLVNRGITSVYIDAAIIELRYQMKLERQGPVADAVAWNREGEERTCDIRLRRHDVAPGPLYAVPQSATDALREAVSAIYFNDSSDYLSALWSVVRSISPETAQLLEENERAAFEQVNPDFKQ